MRFIFAALLGLLPIRAPDVCAPLLPDAPQPIFQWNNNLPPLPLAPLPHVEMATIKMSGDTFPAEVDLSKNFQSTVADQGNEGTCHIFASVALAEAYCNVETGRLKSGKPSLNFSEKYLVYRHLRSKMSSLLKTGNFSGDLLSTDIDSGYVIDTLRRMFNGSILTEDEFKASDKLEQALKPLKIPSNDASEFAHKANDILDAYFLEQMKDSKIEKKESDSGGYYATSLDPDVIKCVASKPEVEYLPYSLKVAVMLLAHGTPFALTTTWTFKNGGSARHAVVIDGYRYTPTLDATTYPEHIEFHVRNSSETVDAWGTHIAEGEITYLSPSAGSN